MVDMIYNLIIMLFDDNKDCYNGIDDEEFIDYVCKGIGITREKYMSVMHIKEN